MVIKKKKLFYDIGIRYVWILCIYVVMSISLNEIVVRGNDYIAQVTDLSLIHILREHRECVQGKEVAYGRKEGIAGSG